MNTSEVSKLKESTQKPNRSYLSVADMVRLPGRQMAGSRDAGQ